MKSTGVDQYSGKMPLARPSGDKVALAIAAMLLGGVIMISTLSLGLHEANLIQRITLLATGGTALGAGAITALLTSRKKPRVEEKEQKKSPPVYDLFAGDYVRNGARSYLVRGSSGWIETEDMLCFEDAMRGIGLNDGEIGAVKRTANQEMMTPVTPAIYFKTEKIGREHHDDELQLVYLISKGQNGPVVEACYRFELASPGVFDESAKKEYVIASHRIELNTDVSEVIVGEVTDQSQKFDLKRGR